MHKQFKSIIAINIETHQLKMDKLYYDKKINEEEYTKSFTGNFKYYNRGLKNDDYRIINIFRLINDNTEGECIKYYKK